jgi:hypothetical protein
LKSDQTKVTKACFRIAFALALSVMLFLPAASADSTITLTSPNAQTSGRFGYSVAINEGDPIVVVGAPGETANALPQAGHAYVLDTTTGLITTLTSPTPQQSFYGYGFGYSVAVSGTTVVVGAPYETANAVSGAGHAYVFDATDGSLITTLTSPNAQAAGLFGNSVAVSGTTVVVGARGEIANTLVFAGHAYVFDATDGSLITTLTSPNAQAGGNFGASVSISGSTVVAGAPSETANALVFAGHAYVFDASTGSLIASLTSPYAQARGDFGFSVSISCSAVVVGASGETANGQTVAGHAYSFDATTGFLTTTLTSPNAQANGGFGSSVAVSGTTVVVGAPSETGSGFTQAGHASIFP